MVFVYTQEEEQASFPVVSVNLRVPNQARPAGRGPLERILGELSECPQHGFR
jgi:hypothetical protein